MLTDSYDFSELERREAGERDTASFDATAPIPLDLSDWGDAVQADADGTGADAATDAQARRNAASS
jgi:hypothetical protein